MSHFPACALSNTDLVMPYLPALPEAFASHAAQAPALRVQPLSPASSSACLIEDPELFSGRFACLSVDPGSSGELLRAKDGVTTFLIVDPLDDLGVSSTPMVQQFRAGSYETCILTTRHSHEGVT